MVPPGFSLPVYTLDYVCYFIRVTTDRWGGKGKLGIEELALGHAAAKPVCSTDAAVKRQSN